MRSVKILGLVLLLVLIGANALAEEGSHGLLSAVEPLSTNITRSAFSDWTIDVTPHTVFLPMDDFLPNPFYLHDLIPGMAVMVHGEFLGGTCIMEARTVMVFSTMNSAAWQRNSPPCGDDTLFGEVSFVDYDLFNFNLWVNNHQGDMLDVRVLPGSQFWEAMNGQPREPLYSIFQFYPGDPIMIHGFQSHNGYRGSIFVKSEDWFPQDYTIGGPEIMEVYGWVDDIYHGQNGELFITVWVDTITGDPNHQTFTKTIGPEGDFLHFPWGHLSFPPGALNQPVDITVHGDFMFWWTLQNTYEFLPSMEFNTPVDIEIRYFNLDQIDPEKVKLVFFNEILERWELACHMTHYPDEHCFRGEIEHFSRYSLSTNNRPLQGVPLQPN